MINTKTNFNDLSKNQLIEYCRTIYIENGIEALSYTNLKTIGNLYWRLYKFGLKQKSLLTILGLNDEYAEYKKSTAKWSFEKIIERCEKTIEEFGYLPPAEWFRKNGYGSLVTALYGLDKTFVDLRDVLNANESSHFVMSKNGMRWRSHPEASFSNFLYTRGIEHYVGRKYSDDYAEYSNFRYGYYDVNFLDNDGDFVDVEIWGDNPNGANAEHYAFKRGIKEKYNSDNNKFLGVEFRDCFDEAKLTNLLERYIGIIEPYIFKKSTDKIIPCTHWSNADELIEYCKEFVKQFPNEEFPTEEWLRKRGKWKDREGVAYNTLAVYIKTWIGGMRKLRAILGQSHVSTIKWNREKALDEYKKWYEKYDLTVGSSRARCKRGQMQLTKEEFHKACNIEMAILKYVGSAVEAQRILGIEVKKKRRKKDV